MRKRRAANHDGRQPVPEVLPHARLNLRETPYRLNHSVPKTRACGAWGLGTKVDRQQEVARDPGSSVTSAGNQRRCRPSSLPANSTSLVRTSPCPDCALNASPGVSGLRASGRHPLVVPVQTAGRDHLADLRRLHRPEVGEALARDLGVAHCPEEPQADAAGRGPPGARRRVSGAPRPGRRPMRRGQAQPRCRSDPPEAIAKEGSPQGDSVRIEFLFLF